MNEYEECLYDYVMEHKFRELGERIEYVLVRKARDDGEQTLREALTGEEKALFWSRRARCTPWSCDISSLWVFPWVPASAVCKCYRNHAHPEGRQAKCGRALY